MKKIIGIVVGVVVALIMFMSFTSIPNGYVGVIYSPNGGIKDYTLSQGWHFVNPLYKVSEYTVGYEHRYYSQDKREGSKDDESFQVATNTSKNVSADISLTYKFDSTRLTEFYKRYKGMSGKQIEHTYIRDTLKTAISNITCNYSLIEIGSTKRAIINQQLNEEVKKHFKGTGIDIININLMQINPDERTRHAIQINENAKQDLEREKIEKSKAIVRAERATIEATNRKAIALLNAQAEADSIKAKAQAIADSNKKIANSLTPELVEYEKIKKWDGKLPKVSGANTLINME